MRIYVFGVRLPSDVCFVFPSSNSLKGVSSSAAQLCVVLSCERKREGSWLDARKQFRECCSCCAVQACGGSTRRASRDQFSYFLQNKRSSGLCFVEREEVREEVRKPLTVQAESAIYSTKRMCLSWASAGNGNGK